MTLDHNAGLRDADPLVAHLIDRELGRQRHGLELIASENFASRAVIDAMGTPLTNKYAEGYPGRRYYGGCEVIDEIEQLAIDRLKQLFGAEHANVQPHSGAQANFAAFMAVIPPGEKIMGMSLPHGGHLSHGAAVNHSGVIWKAVHYGVDPSTGRIDYDVVRDQARRERPRLIIAGGSAYARIIDFAAFRSIADEVEAIFLVDMAHFAGLVAGGVHPSPVPHAPIVTSTTHKTLRGPRAGLILSTAQHAKAIDKSVFPGTQGGPLEHVIAAKAVAFKAAASPEFVDRQQRTVHGARLLAERLVAPDMVDAGVSVLTGGTDVHLVLVDLRDSALDGRQAEDRLHGIGITVNRNAVPFDPRPPMVTSGLRIGTPALATRGFGPEEFSEVADIIATALHPQLSDEPLTALSTRVGALAEAFPLYADIVPFTA